MAEQFAANVMHFARVLRSAGLPVGTDRVELALQALPLVGLHSRRDLHAVLGACLVTRHEHQPMFDQAFQLFWRDPDLLGRMMRMMLPQVHAKPHDGVLPPQNRRLADALFPPGAPPPPEPPRRVELDATLTASARERLHKADFDSMSADEWQAAKRALRTLAPLARPLPTRRMQRSAQHGRADWRATLRAQARSADLAWRPVWQRPRRRPPPLVVLADISGSMSRYSRMLLHFAHALARPELRPGARSAVESFVFGTRLSRITRLLRERDPDLAVAQVVRAVADWSGGTRIGDCLHEFNQRWARRVLSSRATVLLVSDGLEHGDAAALQLLAFEAERLHKSCRRLVWLNPLLRFDRFEPKAGGVRALLPHVDSFVAAHNLDSLQQLAELLARDAAQDGPDDFAGIDIRRTRWN